MWLAQTFETGRVYALGKPEKPRLHVRRKGGDFRDDCLVQDFDAPSHDRYYLIFEMMERSFAKCAESRRLRLVP
ncbi:hypothetical protein A8B73_07940 [Methylosinus sp. 3S-1]|nr:hypothetical protein A8B73_07940 [Methylosinus sp. 3S-1]